MLYLISERCTSRIVHSHMWIFIWLHITFLGKKENCFPFLLGGVLQRISNYAMCFFSLRSRFNWLIVKVLVVRVTSYIHEVAFTVFTMTATWSTEETQKHMLKSHASVERISDVDIHRYRIDLPHTTTSQVKRVFTRRTSHYGPNTLYLFMWYKERNGT